MYAILSTIRFLARQGLPLRGCYQDSCVENSGEIDSKFIQTLKLRTDEVPNLDIWMKRSQDHFTSPDVQNELLQMMALTVICRIAATVAGKKFAVMVDETTDVSNCEQLVFCVRFVDDELNPHEEFVGLHNMETTTALSITKTIEDIMCRLSLTIGNCRG